jgi:protein-L-isoaspartate O-methyltransferase
MRRRRRPLRGRWWVPRVWSWRSTSTPQRSPSPGENLERAGHTDLVLVHGDGGLGYPAHAPYDAICIAAACPDVTPPLIEQLAARGRLIAPVLDDTHQRLTVARGNVGPGADRSATSSACSPAWRRPYDEQLSAPNR